MPYRKLTLSVVLVLVGVFLNFPATNFIGGAIFLFEVAKVLLAIFNKKIHGIDKRSYIKNESINAVLCLCIVLLIYIGDSINANVAQSKANDLISACESYKSKYGMYPDELNALVPEFINEIPGRAKYTITDRGFSYAHLDGGHFLRYDKMPFVTMFYRFEDKKWVKLD